MRKWHSVFFLMLLSIKGWAQTGSGSEKTSPTVFIIIGLVLLVIVVFMLYNKQKRRYND
ncbi:FeoB-associated Cys-rich membrane protein [Sphingobacterium tabacisoli]|uniref:FeoB-associated Cys-rich membrane protein n=1 Tax=Sphingobacterium tabacisoli TaxID=2044855 RepID=A0ABW5L7H8_9SPHI